MIFNNEGTGMENLISIIVPIYNVEKYLNKCIDSIIHQTYKNLEIILVDDGSPDRCPQICDEYAKKDSRIKVFHKKNGGVSSARNIGLINSTGKYIGFIDPDDYIEPTMYEELLNTLKKSNAKISMCGYASIKNNKIINIETYENLTEKIISSEKFLSDILDCKLLGITCNKLFLKDKNSNLQFNENIHYSEDTLLLFDFLNPNDTIAICTKKLYNYIKSESSINENIMSEKKMSCFNAVYLIINICKEKFPNLVDKTSNFKQNFCIKFLLDAYRSSYSKNKKYIPKLRKYLEECNPINQKYRFKKIIALYTPHIYIVILKIKQNCQFKHI